MGATAQPESKIGRIAAVLSVVLSLGLVAYEIRQNTRAVVGQTIQSVADQQTELAILGVESPELRAAWGKSLSGVELTPQERSILGWFYTAVMRHTENRFRQYELGMLEESDLTGLGTQGNLFRNPYFGVWWSGRSDRYPQDFAEYVERELLPLSDPITGEPALPNSPPDPS